MTLPAIVPKLPGPGDRIAGKYEIVRVIGEGGMGIVYEVLHTRLEQRAAIKMLLPRVQMMGEVVARFEREARAACRLRSRYAVRILDVDHDAGRAYMVMEYLEGNDLSHELDMRRKLPVGETVDLVMQACVAMAEAHVSGVVHRDLKPSNLFLVREGGKRIVKVLDFGISKITSEGEAHVTSTFATMGTPLYMSPEQIRSAKNVDARADIWSLGVILFEALAGERPFQGTTTAAAAAIVADAPPMLRTLAPEVPEALEAAVMTALAKKAEERFADVRALAEAIAPFATNGDLLREVVETLQQRATTSVQPARGRAGSTPSFAHATTLAQPTPPVSHPKSPLALSDGAPALGAARSTPGGVEAVSAPSHVGSDAKAASAAPSTEAAWSGREGAPARGRSRVVAMLGGLAVLGAIAGVVVARSRSPGHGARAGDAPSAGATPKESAELPGATAAITTPPPAAAPAPTASTLAPAVTPPAPRASSSAAPPSPTAAPPRSRPHGPSRPAPLSPPSSSPAPSPAPTNPVHL